MSEKDDEAIRAERFELRLDKVEIIPRDSVEALKQRLESERLERVAGLQARALKEAANAGSGGKA